MCSVRSQAAPGTTITSFNLKTLFSGTDSFGGEWFSFSYLFLLSFFLSYSSVSHIYLSLPATIAIPLPPTNKKDPHCIYNPYVRRWIVTGYQQVRNFVSFFLCSFCECLASPPEKQKTCSDSLSLSLKMPTQTPQVSNGRSLTPIAVSLTDVPRGSGTWTTYRVPSWDGSAIAGLTGCSTSTPVRCE